MRHRLHMPPHRLRCLLLALSARASVPCCVQFPWPWLLFKGAMCPAALLGTNETLFQGEELADVGCLQPYSCCGPTCRCAVCACVQRVSPLRAPARKP